MNEGAAPTCPDQLAQNPTQLSDQIGEREKVPSHSPG